MDKRTIMEGILNIIVFISIIPYSSSTIVCGDEICNGDGVYCCTLDSGVEGCCWETYIYQFWWFWVLWISIFLMVLGCSLRIWRRRLRNRRLATRANSQYPTYGTVVRVQGQNRGLVNPVAAQGVPPPPPHGYPQYSPYPPVPPSYSATAPPTYAASEASKEEKPPAYTA